MRVRVEEIDREEKHFDSISYAGIARAGLRVRVEEGRERENVDSLYAGIETDLD